MLTLIIACKNLKRQLRKAFLAAILSAVTVCFLCLYIGSIKSNQEQLSALPDAIPVTASISNLNGSRDVGLQIDGSLLDKIEASGFAANMICTVQTAANFAPETPAERIKPKKIVLTGVNTLAAYQSIQLNGENSGADYFSGKSAQCIANRHFMKKNGLTVGDEIALSVYRHTYMSNAIGTLKYEHLAECSLTITDEFDPKMQMEFSAVPDIIAPIGWVKTVFEENGENFYADSTSFSVKDALRLNEFKAYMKELKLLPVNPQAADSVAGVALVVNDETFIRSASSVRGNLLMLRIFLPLFIIAILMVGYVVSNLIFQSRRGEYAIMRSLGVRKSFCMAIFLFESAVSALSGGAAGALAALLFASIDLSVLVISVSSFFVAYMLGVLTAAYALGRVSVINMLTKAD